jgi:hypothetical protein
MPKRSHIAAAILLSIAFLLLFLQACAGEEKHGADANEQPAGVVDLETAHWHDSPLFPREFRPSAFQKLCQVNGVLNTDLLRDRIGSREVERPIDLEAGIIQRSYAINQSGIRVRERDESQLGRPPLSPIRITGEVLLGGASGAALSVLCAVAGAKTGDPETLNAPAGGIAGFLVGSIDGSSLGVYRVGSEGNQTGSYWAALLGSTAGMATLAGLWLSGVVDADSSTFWIGLYAFPTIGGVAGFNATRRYRARPTSEVAFVNLRGSGELHFMVPRASLRCGLSAKGDLALAVDLMRLNW